LFKNFDWKIGSHQAQSDSILIKEGAWIGAGSIILPGVVIGENAVVGAGSVVTKSISPGAVVGGVPAVNLH
jgi:acetyltransferase-like isoleucine patch superfamily enzyme